MPENEFSADISRFVAKVTTNTDKFMFALCQDIGEAVVLNTPVDIGHLRRSWTAQIGSPDLDWQAGEPRPSVAVSNPSGDAMSRIITKILGVKGGDVVYYNNNVHYGPYVEFGTQHQQAQHFVQDAVSKIDSIAENVASKFKV